MRVVAAIERCAKAGEDFSLNLYRGGVASITRRSRPVNGISPSSRTDMGLDVAGVDILRAARRPR